jgi:alkylhydroperoxidase family enzyme
VPPPEALEESAAKLLGKLPQGDDGPLNLMAVLINNPDLLRGWGRFTATLFPGRLPERERELLILRTAWNVGSGYEWGNHTELGLGLGITPREIQRLTGPLDGEWSEREALLLHAADELHGKGELSRETLEQLCESHGLDVAIEVIFVVGAYHVVRSLVGSLGVRDEPGKPALGEVEPTR